MNWTEIINEIIHACLIPLLGIIAAMIVRAVNAKKDEMIASTDNQLAQKYIDLLADTITQCVIATNQTYVESLKEKNAFDKEAQEEALAMTYQNVMSILSVEAKKYLDTIYGDLNSYILTKIESVVNSEKIREEKARVRTML